MDAIVIHALAKHYPVGFSGLARHVPLDGLTLRVGQCEVFGFLVPNRAGKATRFNPLPTLETLQ
jgi:ABC-type lipopolysaccharide export system ATPase subunit